MPDHTLDDARIDVNEKSVKPRTNKDKSQDESRDDDDRYNVPFRFRGIPRGYLCRSRDVMAELGMSRPTWNEWILAGLRVTQPGTSAEMVYTDDVIEFARTHPELPKRKKSKAT